MDIDDLEPRKTDDFQIGGDLSKLSVDELKTLASTLADEIKRIEDELKSKESSRDAADAVFKS